MNETTKSLEVLTEISGHIQIGLFGFSSNCEFITYSGRGLKNPNKQTQILLRKLIPAYAKGYGLNPERIKNFLYLDYYFKDENQPDSERIRDWVANSQRARIFWGKGKLIESSRLEISLNPLWVPPTSAYK